MFGDFNKPFKDLEEWTSNAVQIETWKDNFLKEYPKIFNGFSENEDEMNIDIDTTMKAKPPIDREEKLRKVEEKLLSKRTDETFTNYDGVMSDDNLSRPQKIIHLQKAIGNATRRKILYASSQGELLEESFHQSKKVYEDILVETKVQFLGKLYKLALDYNQITYCTVPLSYIRSDFKIIEEICKCNKERWK